MKKNVSDENLRSKSVQELLSKPPSLLVRYGAIFLLLFFIIIGYFVCHIPYSRNIDIKVNIYKDSTSLCIKAKIPENFVRYFVSGMKMTLDVDNEKLITQSYELKFNKLVKCRKNTGEYFILSDRAEILHLIPLLQDSLSGNIHFELKNKNLITYMKK